MNYLAHYERLIAGARGRVLEGYRELHHVVPKCMGGNNSASNLIDLTAEEHYVAHQLLVHIYPHIPGLIVAAIRMSRQCSGNKSYGWLRRRLSRSLTGVPLSQSAFEKMVAIRRSPAGRALSAAKQTGKKYSPESKLKMSLSRKGIKIPREVVEKSAASRMGRVMSVETKAKISQKAMGNKRGMGTKRSLEFRLKMSEAAKLRVITPETRRKMMESKERKKLCQALALQ